MDYSKYFGDCSKCGSSQWGQFTECYGVDDKLSTVDAVCEVCGHSPQVEMDNLKEPEGRDE